MLGAGEPMRRALAGCQGRAAGPWHGSSISHDAPSHRTAPGTDKMDSGEQHAEPHGLACCLLGVLRLQTPTKPLSTASPASPARVPLHLGIKLRPTAS